MAGSFRFDLPRGDMRDAFGPLVALSPPTDRDDGFALIRALLPPGTVVPLHAHADREVLLILCGALSIWRDGAWGVHGVGAVVDIRPDVQHALRNEGATEVCMAMATTARMNRFFDEISAPAQGVMPPPDERMARFMATATAYGYWNGSPEEQRRIGIEVAP